MGSFGYVFAKKVFEKLTEGWIRNGQTDTRVIGIHYYFTHAPLAQVSYYEVRIDLLVCYIAQLLQSVVNVKIAQL